MGHYLFNFSKKGAAKGRTLREQAAELLELRLWGIGAKTPSDSASSAITPVDANAAPLGLGLQTREGVLWEVNRDGHEIMYRSGWFGDGVAVGASSA